MNDPKPSTETPRVYHLQMAKEHVKQMSAEEIDEIIDFAMKRSEDLEFKRLTQ